MTPFRIAGSSPHRGSSKIGALSPMTSETATDSAVLPERHDGVAVITFNRPERLNAWSADIGQGLVQRLEEAEEDPEVRGVVLTGAGRGFSAGADLKNRRTHSVGSPEEYLDSHRNMHVFDMLQTYSKPVIADVNGYAIAIGCLVPLCCDFVVGSEKAIFCLLQVSLGILPAYVGTLRLARFVGRGNALNIALTGRKVGADEALRMGILTTIYPHEKLVPEAINVMQSIAAMPVHTVRLARESLHHGYESGLAATEQANLYRFMALAQTNDRADRHEAWR